MWKILPIFVLLAGASARYETDPIIYLLKKIEGSCNNYNGAMYEVIKRVEFYTVPTESLKNYSACVAETSGMVQGTDFNKEVTVEILITKGFMRTESALEVANQCSKIPAGNDPRTYAFEVGRCVLFFARNPMYELIFGLEYGSAYDKCREVHRIKERFVPSNETSDEMKCFFKCWTLKLNETVSEVFKEEGLETHLVHSVFRREYEMSPEAFLQEIYACGEVTPDSSCDEAHRTFLCLKNLRRKVNLITPYSQYMMD